MYTRIFYTFDPLLRNLLFNRNKRKLRAQSIWNTSATNCSWAIRVSFDEKVWLQNLNAWSNSSNLLQISGIVASSTLMVCILWLPVYWHPLGCPKTPQKRHKLPEYFQITSVTMPHTRHTLATTIFQQIIHIWIHIILFILYSRLQEGHFFLIDKSFSAKYLTIYNLLNERNSTLCCSKFTETYRRVKPSYLYQI